MRVAFTADNQVDEHSRLEEHDRVMEFIAEDAARRGCELMLHGGDVYERRSTERERASVRSFFGRVLAFMNAALVGGNHEASGEVEELNEMVGGEYELQAFESPFVLVPEDTGTNAAVACLPWPRKAELLKRLDDPTAPEESDRIAQELLRDVLRGFRSELHAHDGPRILLAHAMVRGSKQGPDQPIVGGDMELGLEDLALAGADVVLLGHVHMPQEWEYDGVPMIYAGSPRRTAYAAGELVEKSYVVLEFGTRGADGRMPVSWERVPTPATPMVLLEEEWDDAWSVTDPGTAVAAAFQERGDLTGAEIRFRYSVDPDRRDAARDWMRRWAAAAVEAGAAEVRLDPVVRAVSVARAPEVAEARGVRDQLVAYWRAAGTEPEEPRRSTLLERAAELEGGA